jgi:hypothetical protein
MQKLLLLAALIAFPVWAQAQPTSSRAPARADVCAPIGKTAKGELVYAMKCDKLPAVAAPAQIDAREPAPPPEPEVRKGGLFGWSFDRRKSDE